MDDRARSYGEGAVSIERTTSNEIALSILRTNSAVGEWRGIHRSLRRLAAFTGAPEGINLITYFQEIDRQIEQAAAAAKGGKS